MPLAALLASAQAESAPPGVASATATLHPDNSLIAEIAVELDASGRVYVEYHGPAGTLRSATTPEPARTVTVPLVRLLPDSVYRYTVVPVAADDTAGTPGTPGSAAEGTFRTRALPPALARLQIDVTGEPTAELVLLDLQDNPDSFFLFLDRAGASSGTTATGRSWPTRRRRYGRCARSPITTSSTGKAGPRAGS